MEPAYCRTLREVLYATSAYALKIYLYQMHQLLIRDQHLDELVRLDELVLHLLMDLQNDMDLAHLLNLALQFLDVMVRRGVT